MRHITRPFIYLFFFSFTLLVTSCERDDEDEITIEGLWRTVSLLENGILQDGTAGADDEYFFEGIDFISYAGRVAECTGGESFSEPLVMNSGNYAFDGPILFLLNTTNSPETNIPTILEDNSLRFTTTEEVNGQSIVTVRDLVRVDGNPSNLAECQ